MNVYMETMGCQMNRLDSELLLCNLCAAGHEMVEDREAADVILYNTCSVRVHAEEKVHSRLGVDGPFKTTLSRPLIIGVLGCMAQREGESLLRRHPHVDIVCGPGQLHRLPDLIALAAAGEPSVAIDPDRREVSAGAIENIDRLDNDRDPLRTPSQSQAYVRVMKGCDNFCTYCIVPYVRGKEVSRQPEHIVEETRRLVGAGRTEITLLGQTVNRYRYSRGEKTVRFSDLLARVASVEGLRRLRFVTSHPLDFTTDIIEAMRDLPNVCEQIHCPAQSGSDTVLKRMNRKYSRAEYDDLIDRARAIVPEMAFLGDFIVGFPQETEEDHQASVDLIRRTGYRNSFVFKYSPRPGTLAARKYEDDVPLDIKKRRNNDLLAVQQEVSLVHHRATIGRQMEVLVEGPSARSQKQRSPTSADSIQLTGRTRGGHIVVFDGPTYLKDDYVLVDIVDASALVLFGVLPGKADGDSC